MTQIEKLEAIKDAYITKTRPNGDEIYILADTVPEEVRTALWDIQQNLGVDFDPSYEIMASACGIIAEKTLTGADRDSLTSDDLDLYADADSAENVYTTVQLSYLNLNNEAEISELMKDESITSIAQASAVWHTQRVVDACEAIKEYILAA